MGLVEEKVKKYLTAIEKDDKKGDKINAFLQINENVLAEARKIDEKVVKTGKKGRLYGYVIGVKAVINVLGLNASCASRVLENYISTYDASVISKIKAEDGIIIGMLNCDEFACGTSGERSAFGATQNPSCLGRIPGGSSSGSAAAVAAGFCDVSLGSDTGGSIRNPSSHCNVVGVKPSYGLVSRYGLIDLSMSLDQIAPIGKNVEDVALLLDVIKGKDEKDTKTFNSDRIKMEEPKKLKIGILKVKNVDPRIQKIIDDKITEAIKKYKWTSEKVEIEHLDLAVQTYYPIVYVEIFSASRRYDGRKYGYKIEEKCGSEVLRRILGGSEITKAEFKGAYYRKALQVKEIIKEEFEKAFEKIDCLICPVVPILPWKVGEGAKMSPEEDYACDALTTPANLAGICAISIPAGIVKDKKDSVPIGIQIMCNSGEESKLLSIAREIEKLK